MLKVSDFAFIIVCNYSVPNNILFIYFLILFNNFILSCNLIYGFIRLSVIHKPDIALSRNITRWIDHWKICSKQKITRIFKIETKHRPYIFLHNSRYWLLSNLWHDAVINSLCQWRGYCMSFPFSLFALTENSFPLWTFTVMHIKMRCKRQERERGGRRGEREEIEDRTDGENSPWVSHSPFLKASRGQSMSYIENGRRT